MELAELNLKIVSDQVQTANKRLDELEKKGKSAERAATSLSRSFGQQEGIMSRLANKYQQIILLMSGLTAGAGLVASAFKAIRIAAEFEQVEVGFKGMLGSAEKASKMLKDLESFATETPFQFKDLAQTAKLMLALGIEASKIEPTLRTIGDATSALGGGAPLMERLVLALGQMQAKGKVASQEMRQLAEAGVPAWQFLADAIGTSVPEAMERVEKELVPLEVAMDAMLDGMNKRFAGGMKAQSKTTLGLWSTLMDNLYFAARDAGAAIIEAFDIRGMLEKLIAATDHYKGIIIDTIRLLAGLPAKFGATAQVAEKLARGIRAAAAGLAAFVALEMGVKSITLAMTILSGVMAVNPLTLVAVGIAAATAALVYFRDTEITIMGKTAQLQDIFISSFEVMKEQITHVYTYWVTLAEETFYAVSNMAARTAINTAAAMYKIAPGLMHNMASVAKFFGGTSTGKGGKGTPGITDLVRLPVEAILGEIMARAEQRSRGRGAPLVYSTMGDFFPDDLEEGFNWDDVPRGSSSAGAAAASRRMDPNKMREAVEIETAGLRVSNQERDKTVALLQLQADGWDRNDEAVQKYIAALQKLQDTKKLREIADGIGDAFGKAFEDAILSAQSFREVLQSLAIDIERVLLRKLVTEQIASWISSGIMGIGKGFFGSANGNVFMGGNMVAFANGGVVGGPTAFPMRNGRFGLMGEAGPEAIMPLKRDQSGRLGVEASGNRPIIFNITTPNADSFRASRRQIAADMRRLTR